MNKIETLHIIGIAGSLRKASINRALLRTAKELVPENMKIEIYDIADFPLYNEDVYEHELPVPVHNLKEKIRESEGLLIATPEYNYSIPGVLKNAIDWISRTTG